MLRDITITMCYRPEKDMVMEIMDKYVQAGEALAEKENDARQLMKQVRLAGLKLYSILP